MGCGGVGASIGITTELSRYALTRTVMLKGAVIGRESSLTARGAKVADLDRSSFMSTRTIALQHQSELSRRSATDTGGRIASRVNEWP